MSYRRGANALATVNADRLTPIGLAVAADTGEQQPPIEWQWESNPARVAGPIVNKLFECGFIP